MFNSLKLNKDKPIYLQIESYIKDMINKGLLVENYKLPATREVSKVLKISRNSIITAYENLEAEGFIYTVKGKGTFVKSREKKNENKWNMDWKDRVNFYGSTARNLDIVKSEISWEKGFLSFKSISPDGKMFDIEEIKKAFLNIISLEEDKILNYGYAKGYKPLLEYLSEYMRSKGVDTYNKDIIITNGFTEGLEMVMDAFTKEGDKILCENPTHNTSLKIMKLHKLEIEPIKMNREGIDLEDLKVKLKKNEYKFLYLTPSYHNPTGIVMNSQKRYEVYNILKEKNIPIIEDGFSEELLYNSSHISPIAALDNGGNGVIYIGSFSKILYPGMRIGWVLADKEIIDILESVKRCKNIHTSFLDQGIFYEYLKAGAFERDVKKIRKFYREKYAFTIKCIKKYIPNSTVSGEGGLHIFVSLNNIDTRALLKECYKKKVIFMPGDIFYVNGEGKNTMRLGFSHLSLEEIEKGIKIIGYIVKSFKEY